ncbi:torsin-1A-interacting protein 2-like isoform X1 [Phyllopteryx taeniolatus]|uniref:torsin-1A-interacting protein 2-like isoform X1 n=1 Tax=Phyllopteryx taeniolatus TaxID=161469 RepID=UPI002AD22C66|nr:torsin-1A-interacting protein 2-like isoform X1 [Phyllopteryx taeniolatus]
MDTDVSEDTVRRAQRRSMRRQSIGKTLIFEATPRAPLKRSKREKEKKAASSSVPNVNGSRNVENGTEDEESPSKKSRLEEDETSGGSGDKKQMDDHESVLEQNADHEMDIEEDAVHGRYRPKIALGSIGDVNLSPFVVLGERCHLSDNTDRYLLKPKEVFTKPSAPTRSSDNTHNQQGHKITSMAEYKKEMEAKAKGPDVPRVNHYSVPSVHAPSVTLHKIRQRANNVPAQKEPIPQKKPEIKKIPGITKRGSEESSRGFLHYFCCLVLLLLLLSSAVLLVYKNKLISVYQRSAERAGRPSRDVRLEPFADLFSQLEARFHSQRPELWKRSRTHLEKHLKSTKPTEPVSLILTSGRDAQKTLSCLAEGLASAFSSALKASVLLIDGASKAGLESDEVKLDIDGQLQAAFGGNRAAAVIHSLEELPPGSTLIFYRYCDHEHAAYKEVFLLFTVLLPQDAVSGELGVVEELVQDYLKDRLVAPSSHMAFNEMDTDKFGGLWSRISHLVLPVVAEKEVEQNGC